MGKCLVQSYAVLLILLYTYVSAEVTFEDGGYSVSVSFSQNVSPEGGKMLLENMKATLESASKILYESTGLQFTKVTFKIPESWNKKEWTISAEDTIDSNHKTDFLVDSTNDTVFGKFPSAQQYGGCGTPGHRIIIPTAFFDEENGFPRGISLVREWLKYRYGVFDENGYFKDELYPLYYNIPGSDSNEMKVTDCANVEIAYDFKDQSGNNCTTSEDTLRQKLDSGQCIISVDEESAQSVTSSLMYYQKDINNMLHVCGKDSDHPHNFRSPNKQNALCYGKSIWDIVSKSKDLKNEGIKQEYGDISYVYVEETKPAVVIAWENTLKLKKKGDTILNAINKFMIDLPDGSKFSAFPFKKTVISKIKNFQDLNTLADRQSVSTGIFSNFVVDEDGDINRAIERAVQIFESSVTDPAELKGDIFIITATSNKIEDSILDMLKEGLCVKIFFFGEGDDIPEEVKKYATDLPCGKVEVFSMVEKHEETFKKLIEAMGENSLSYVENKAIETEKIEYLTKELAIIVKAEDSVEIVSFWIFSKKETDDFVLKLNGETQEKGITTEIIGNVIEMSYTPSQPGIVELFYPYETEPMLTQVTITSKEGEYFTAEVIVFDTTVEGDIQMPVIIYAIIRKGAYPVQNAKVSATIDGPEELHIELDLYDDGKGDPDITENDGIYSRYFTSFTEKGEYTVTISATNEGKSATIGQVENSGYHTCCGSSVPRGSQVLPEFTKVNKTKFDARSGKPEGGYKPSRISDLRIEKVTEDVVVLKWSAPGAEADSGTASTYEIKLFCGEENVTECKIYTMVRMLNKPSPLNYGREQQIKLQILKRTQVLTVGIITMNEKNKTSYLSNIVEIFRPTETPDVIITDPIMRKSQASRVGTIIGCIIAGILVLICILAIIYFRRKSKRRKSEAHEIEENNDKQKVEPIFKVMEYSVKNEPIKKIESFPVLLYTHDQIKDYKNKENDLYKTNIPPKQWRSLDVINLKSEDHRDTKSLGSSSTINPEDRTENNGKCDNNS